MDTKWKKWKSKIASVLFILGLSFVVMSIGMLVYQIYLSYSLLGSVQLKTQEDYQRLRPFRSGICERLDTCLTIANGTFINWSYYDQYIYPKHWEMASEGLEDYWEIELHYDEYGNVDYLTSEEKEQMAINYLSYWDNDFNVLYQITVDGIVKYTNMENSFSFGDTLPEGYSFLLYFNGEKVQIIKDGREIDVYGDGIYDSSKDYAVPGYMNYKADSSLKNVSVALIAIKTPLEYHMVGNNNEFFDYDNTYYLYQNMKEFNNGWLNAMYFGIVGILLLIPAIIIRRSAHIYREKFANFVNKIWIEAKLLFVILAVSLGMHLIPFPGFYYSYRFSYTISNSSLPFPYFGERLMSLINPLFDNHLYFLVFFWIMYLVIFDIKYNRKKKQNSLLLMFVKNFNARNLKLSFSKRAIRRASLLLLCTVISIFFFGLGLILYAEYHGESFMIFPIIGLFVLFVSFFQYCRTLRSQAADLDMLNDQIRNLSHGDYNLQKMTFTGNDFEDTENNLLQIQNGIKNAVEEQIRSERMKVDLVTNVSHDLKTPLTSIISYVQFLKEEDTLPEHVKDYIRILDEKSSKLADMVQDVFSISKATSGQLPVQMEILDFGKLLNQTLADMEEIIIKSNITIKKDIPEHVYFIEADGQRMYRVCQNLIQNALKYSLEGSRIYISLKNTKNQAVATFMNTSKTELDQDTDFTARFVRGDSSRTDGGSGLGLSIAKSFTEACGGEFSININGDAFIVTIALNQKNHSESESV